MFIELASKLTDSNLSVLKINGTAVKDGVPFLNKHGHGIDIEVQILSSKSEIWSVEKLGNGCMTPYSQHHRKQNPIAGCGLTCQN